MSMQEAFRQAAKENPHSPIAQVIEKVNQSQAAERMKQRRKRQEEKRLNKVKNQYYELGRMWFKTQINKTAGMLDEYYFIPIEAKRKIWKTDLTSLKEKPSEERIELLNALASGMQLTEETIPAAYKKQDVPLSNPLSSSSLILSGLSFTPQSVLFMNAISDMLGYSIKQKNEFKYFMVIQSGLTWEVELPQLFPAISQWLNHK